MANRYWVGGSGSWLDTAKWSTTSGGTGGASVPTSADDAFIDSNSGSGTVSLSGSNGVAKSLNCTGFSGGFSVSGSNFTVSGSVTFGSNMTISISGSFFTLSGSLTLSTGGSFSSSGITMNATGTITSAGKTVGSVTVASGTTTLADAFIGSLSIAAGAGLTTGGNSITGNLTTGGSATVNIGNSVINGSTVSFSSTDTLTVGTSSNITAATFFGGGKSFRTVSVSSTIADGGNTFNNLTFTGTSIAGNQTISTFTCSGSSVTSRQRLFSSTFGSQITLSITTWATRQYVDFRDVALSPSRSGTSFGDCGGNSGVTFTAAKTVYWNGGTGSWTGSVWTTTSGGTPGSADFPLAQDTVVFDDSNSVGTVTVSGSPNIGIVNMSGRTSAMTMSVTGTPTVYGNWTTGAGVSYTGSTGSLSFSGGRSGSQLLTWSGKTFSGTVAIASVGTVELQDAFSVNALYLSSGTFSTNSYNIAATSVQLVGGTLSAGTTVFTVSGTGASAWLVTGSPTITGSGSISMTGATSKTFAGGNLNYGSITLNQGGAGALTVSGSNTFGNISNTYGSTGATTITFSSNQTVANFTATGTLGKILTINSSSVGVQRTLTKTGGGVVSVDYLNLRDSNATGSGAAWYAGSNSTNSGNITGWIFSGPSGGGFLAFFM